MTFHANPTSIPPVEEMTMPQFGGYLASQINTARILMECGQAKKALEILAAADEAVKRRVLARP